MPTRPAGPTSPGWPTSPTPGCQTPPARDRAAFQAKHADKARYGTIRYAGFGPVSAPFAPAGSVDVVITSREIHNWIRGGYFDKALKDCYAALKPGGVLAVEEHRADPKPQVANAENGYVATDTVVNAATKAGFKLDGASELNANPKDDKDHPFGVWTLPPTRDSSGAGHPPPHRRGARQVRRSGRERPHDPALPQTGLTPWRARHGCGWRWRR